MGCQLSETLVHHKSLTRFDDLQTEAVWLTGSDDCAIAFLIGIGHGDCIRVQIIRHDIHYIYIEHLSNLLADQFIYRLHVQLGDQSFLHFVDDL